MKALIIGKHGQLAKALQESGALRRDIQILAVGRLEVDLETAGSVSSVITAAEPDVVINAAAYTAVDQAEDEPERAFRINADAAGEASIAARAVGAPIIHISTDYVFDGSAEGAYVESDSVNPLGVYGRSKLAGEEQVRATNPEHVIIRTAWLYSPWGRNFVKTMLRLGRERKEVSVVADQLGSPTSAPDLANALLILLDRWRDGAECTGETYHLAGRGHCSWAEFAEEIFRISAAEGGQCASVRRITTAEFPTQAIRPQNSTLDSSKFAWDFGYRLPEWRQSVSEVVRRLAGAKC